MTFFFNPLFLACIRFLSFSQLTKICVRLPEGWKEGLELTPNLCASFLLLFSASFFSVQSDYRHRNRINRTCAYLASKYDRYRPINLLFEKLFCQFLVYHIFRLTPFLKTVLMLYLVASWIASSNRTVVTVLQVSMCNVSYTCIDNVRLMFYKSCLRV